MNRISSAISNLLGRDKETPEDRAFRHEREKVIYPLLLQGLSYLCLALVMILLFGSISSAIQVAGYSLLAYAVVLFVANSILKWHQNKYGGD